MVSVFVSYRREDSAGYAGRLCEHLGGVFGAEHVFLDVHDIAPGQDFAEAIEKTIAACQAVVVVIGPRWLADLKQRAGGEDFVHHEISVALRRNVVVIPLLVGGGVLPSPAELPESLAALCRRQALEIRDARFDDDAKVLIGALRQVPGISSHPVRGRGRRWKWIAVAAAVLALAAGAFLWKGAPAFDIDGLWLAEMQRPDQPPFRVRLDLVGSAGKLTGNVAYPTGEGAIQEGTLRSGRLAFFTVHVPQFASEPATIRWTGVVEGGAIRFTAAYDSGVARGLARRGP
jgi:hypothetical protein